METEVFGLSAEDVLLSLRVTKESVRKTAILV